MKIEYTSLERASGFWHAIDQVARERQYLLFKKAPEIDRTRSFLKEIIEKKKNVPTKVIILFKNPSIPTIFFVAVAINVILDIIRKVIPPLFEINSIPQTINPSSRIDADGIKEPP